MSAPTRRILAKASSSAFGKCVQLPQRRTAEICEIPRIEMDGVVLRRQPRRNEARKSGQKSKCSEAFPVLFGRSSRGNAGRMPEYLGRSAQAAVARKHPQRSTPRLREAAVLNGQTVGSLLSLDLLCRGQWRLLFVQCAKRHRSNNNRLNVTATGRSYLDNKTAVAKSG
jgi:hypothetical protein